MFPADDQVSRWITVCAMALNDLLYVNRLLVPRLKEEVESEDYENVYLARVAGAHLFEIAKFLGHTYRRIPGIGQFIDGLGPDPKAVYEKVKAVGPNGSSDFPRQLGNARGRSFTTRSSFPRPRIGRTSGQR